MAILKEGGCILEKSRGCLRLKKPDEPRLGSVYVDFTAGRNRFRRKFGGGRRQAIARAVGLKRGACPTIVDATGGLGADAFVLASLGCRVHMMERSAMVAALLEDGLRRAALDPEIGPWVSRRMSLGIGDSLQGLKNLTFSPDVVYLDPMYPPKRKSALAKKEMCLLQTLVGDDPDADELLVMALKAAKSRVVVKRPAYAGHLAGRRPKAAVKLKKHRFDIYLTQKPAQVA